VQETCEAVNATMWTVTEHGIVIGEKAMKAEIYARCEKWIGCE
jgi:hypothetical protein